MLRSYLSIFVPESVCYQYTSVGPFLRHNFVGVDVGDWDKATRAEANEYLRDPHDGDNIVCCA